MKYFARCCEGKNEQDIIGLPSMKFVFSKGAEAYTVIICEK